MNNIISKIRKGYIAMSLLLTQSVFAAANFNITPLGALPTSVTIGQSVSAFYTITNQTNGNRTGYQVQGLPATVVQNSTPPNCPNPITLGPKASCVLQLDITAAVSSNFAICNGNSCTTATTPLNISASPNRAPLAYVTNDGSILLCQVDSTNGSLTSCIDAGAGINNIGIAVDNSGHYAYITEGNFQGSVKQCIINQSTYTFDSCISTPITSPTYTARGGLLALNNTNTIAYIVNNGPAEVLACPITNGLIGSACTNTGANNLSLSGNNVGIVFNPTQTTAYIGSSSLTDAHLTVCTVSGTSFIPPCIKKFGGGSVTFSAPSGVGLNPDGTFLYVADSVANSVYVCNTTPNSSPTFQDCVIAATIPSAWDVTINKTGTFAYVTDFSAIVYSCPILADRTFGPCNQISIPSPISVALF